MATKPKSVQVLIRVTAEQRDRYKDAAEAEGFSLSEWVRRMSDVRSAEVLDCTHPSGLRESYTWSETCTKCGVRVREGDSWLIPDVLR